MYVLREKSNRAELRAGWLRKKCWKDISPRRCTKEKEEEKEGEKIKRRVTLAFQAINALFGRGTIKIDLSPTAHQVSRVSSSERAANSLFFVLPLFLSVLLFPPPRLFAGVKLSQFDRYSSLSLYLMDQEYYLQEQRRWTKEKR